MEWPWLVPLMPLLGTLPIAVAAIVVAKLLRRRRDAPVDALEAQNRELRDELDVLRRELAETQERLDFTERVLTQQSRRDPLPPPQG
ncbi:MAG TPA: hypothetical protein VFU46_13435 [Gemmatimonadales bacterium]|nr:hypothetical protein [Gemmatimonadales bacterium]